MDRTIALTLLRRHERELRHLGIASLALFGSTARNEARADSDVDLVATFGTDARMDLFRYAALVERLRTILDRSVDLVSEPVRKAAIREAIAQERISVY